MSHASIIVALDCPGDIEKQVEHEMEPFDESGKWFADGSRWDWWVIGGRYSGKLLGADYCLRSDLTESAMIEHNRNEARELWDRYQKDEDKFHPFVKAMYDFADDETLESLIRKYEQNKITAYAFLHHQRWHENQRLGFFGGIAQSECEIAGREKGKCIVGKISEPPCIIGFNEPDERWEQHYWPRFIENLPGDTMLVSVDYHV